MNTPCVTAEQLAQSMASVAELFILDVRRGPAFEKNPLLIKGAQRVPPEDLSDWAARHSASKGIPVVVYCVYGHEVSQGAATALKGFGYDAVYLEGGISQWQAQGRQLESHV